MVTVSALVPSKKAETFTRVVRRLRELERKKERVAWPRAADDDCLAPCPGQLQRGAHRAATGSELRSKEHEQRLLRQRNEFCLGRPCSG
jgi:hypothetical protein